MASLQSKEFLILVGLVLAGVVVQLTSGTIGHILQAAWNALQRSP